MNKIMNLTEQVEVHPEVHEIHKDSVNIMSLKITNLVQTIMNFLKNKIHTTLISITWDLMSISTHLNIIMNYTTINQ
jgi:hypothetical protein